MEKGEIAMEQLVRMILALLVLVAVIGVFYYLFRPTINNIFGIQEESAEHGGNVLDDIFRAIRGKCKEGDPPSCNHITNQKRICRNGEWVSEGECDKEKK